MIFSFYQRANSMVVFIFHFPGFYRKGQAVAGGGQSAGRVYRVSAMHIVDFVEIENHFAVFGSVGQQVTPARISGFAAGLIADGDEQPACAGVLGIQTNFLALPREGDAANHFCVVYFADNILLFDQLVWRIAIVSGFEAIFWFVWIEVQAGKFLARWVVDIPQANESTVSTSQHDQYQTAQFQEIGIFLLVVIQRLAGQRAAVAGHRNALFCFEINQAVFELEHPCFFGRGGRQDKVTFWVAAEGVIAFF